MDARSRGIDTVFSGSGFGRPVYPRGMDFTRSAVDTGFSGNGDGGDSGSILEPVVQRTAAEAPVINIILFLDWVLLWGLLPLFLLLLRQTTLLVVQRTTTLLINFI